MDSTFKTVILSLLLLLVGKAYGQEPSYSQSVLHQLKQINGVKDQDSIHFKKVVELIQQNKKESLLESQSIIGEIERIKTVISDKEYYNFLLFFYYGHYALDEIPYESLITFGKNFIERNKTGCTGPCNEALLLIIRVTRIPYRNSSFFYDGIDYYINLANYFVENNNPDAASVAYSVLPGFFRRIGLPEKQEYYTLKSISFLNDNPANDTLNALLGTSGKANRYLNLGSMKTDNNRPQEGEKYLFRAIAEYSKLKDTLKFGFDAPFLFLQMARAKTLLKSDSSSFYYDKAERLLKSYNVGSLDYAWYYLERAKDYLSKNQIDSAKSLISKTQVLKKEPGIGITSPFGELIPNYYAATIALMENKPADAVQLLESEIKELQTINAKFYLVKEFELLAEAYAALGDFKNAYASQQELLSIKNSLEAEAEEAKILNFEIEKKIQENEINLATLNERDEANKKIAYYLYLVIGLLTLSGIILGIAIRNKQKSNHKLSSKKAEVESALEQLKSTQSQLIQSEKMASLGELTAGIAHEIQNPLNFVNNFSEVSNELIDEMKDEFKKGDTKEGFAIADDIKQNLEKITHHGKRADAIVKGMLAHSRSSSGEKVLTDINELADEYLRLSYHGLRAKDSSFNAECKTDLDPNLPKVNVIPQDIGRVLLNLINNAFQSVHEKQKTSGADYDPEVTVSTKLIFPQSGGLRGACISVSDNGPGIPEAIKDKIFQPFFTTKPTGQGTGLGLSLSYDIVKAHGGEISVASTTNKGATFKITLPNN